MTFTLRTRLAVFYTAVFALLLTTLSVASYRVFARQLDAWAARRDLEPDAVGAVRAVVVWSRLHGLVSLEIAGNFDSMGLDADALFETELQALV